MITPPLPAQEARTTVARLLHAAAKEIPNIPLSLWEAAATGEYELLTDRERTHVQALLVLLNSAAGTGALISALTTQREDLADKFLEAGITALRAPIIQHLDNCPGHPEEAAT